MDFLIDNYLWFIIGGIVLIMIVIGYFAEKTDFGRKPFDGNNNDNENNKQSEENINLAEIENKRINDVLGQTNKNVAEDELVEPISNESTEDNFEDVEILPNLDLEKPELDVSPTNALEEIETNDVETPDIPEIIEEDDDINEDDVWKF